MWYNIMHTCVMWIFALGNVFFEARTQFLAHSLATAKWQCWHTINSTYCSWQTKPPTHFALNTRKWADWVGGLLEWEWVGGSLFTQDVFSNELLRAKHVLVCTNTQLSIELAESFLFVPLHWEGRLSLWLCVHYLVYRLLWFPKGSAKGS